MSTRSDWQLIAAGSALFATGVLFSEIVSYMTKLAPGTIPSPRTTLLPNLSHEEISNLPYPPDALPGARDVESPYGTIRVYEWGPEDGRKVLLIHGISTPSIALGNVARGLVEHGCRVMLFDLFGRGYSDAPRDLPQDTRLFTTEILLALASSPLSWTGASSNKFSVVGYSFGGAMAADFASYFPDLLDTVVLLAPGGLIRDSRRSQRDRLLYSQGFIPEPLIYALVKSRLRQPMYLPKEGQFKGSAKKEPTTIPESGVDLESNVDVPVSSSSTKATPQDAVAHQVENHSGFVHSFISSIRVGPIQHQHPRWKQAAQHIDKKNALIGGLDVSERPYKVLVVAGSTDPVIVRSDLEEDAQEIFHGNMEFVVLEAGHEVAITKSKEIVHHIIEYWKTLPQHST